MKYNSLAITSKEDLLFGTAPKPVETKRGLLIGGGNVFTELNFTLPPMNINSSTVPEIKNQYGQIIKESIERAIQLGSKGVVFEFETLLEMTMNPEIGIELTKIMNDICEDYYQKNGFKSEIRLTPNDTRDFSRPPKMRTSEHLESMLELFEKGALAGGDILSIESTGGKEICDDAILNCNIKEVIFALTVLGVRDMKFLWKKIVQIAKDTNRIAGGDTACGFGNTAMVLAEKNYIPKIFAAIVRIITIVRTLVAYEEGATGPDKDCAYEGPFIKAITGIPISMEGKTAACAHMSPIGNISAACCDLWSNESVQNIKLLGGWAPTVYLEQLEYDVRLFNQSLKDGKTSAKYFQNLLVKSDMYTDPQAFILAPENVILISDAIVKGKNYIESAILGSLKGLELIQAALDEKILRIDKREQKWLDIIRDEILSIPIDEGLFIEQMLPNLDPNKVVLSEYGL